MARILRRQGRINGLIPNRSNKWVAMDSGEIIAFKIFLHNPDSDKPEIRRFALQANVVANYNVLTGKITEVFPVLSDKVFTIYWKDEEEDEIAVSSDEELIIALISIKSDVKKFYVKIQSPVKDSNEKGNARIHTSVFCDECECNIIGFRYKCLICDNYDLCSVCEQRAVHAEHPMLRIPEPNLIDYENLIKLSQFLQSVISMRIDSKHHRRRHSQDRNHGDFCKKRRCDRPGLCPEGEDSKERNIFDKNFCKKYRKINKCPYDQLVNGVFHLFNRDNFQSNRSNDCASGPSANSQEDIAHPSYLNSIGKTLQKLFDPLGVTVELEVRPKSEKHEEKKEREDEKQEKQTPASTSSTPPQKEVRFSTNQQISETLKQKIDEITKTLANQAISNTKVADNDGWVSFEELKKDSEETQSNGIEETIPTASTSEQAKASDAENSSQSEKIKINLYPDLNRQRTSDAKIKAALEMLSSMGFTDEGDELVQLLEVKQRDINHALDILDSQKQN